MSTLTKIAFVRGVAQAMQSRGTLRMPNTETLSRVSDKVATWLDGQMEEPAQGQVSNAAVAKIAQALLNAQQQLEGQGVKVAGDVRNIQYQNWDGAIGDLVATYSSKVASELGSAIGQPHTDAPNDLANAAAHDVNAALENMRRPEGYAEGPQGVAGFSEPQAARTGMESPAAHQDLSVGPATNSVVEASKAAHFNINRILKQANTPGAPVGTPAADTPNTMPVDVPGKQDPQQQMFNNVGGEQGVANKGPVPAAVIGVETPSANQDMHTGASDNSVTKLSHAQREALIAGIVPQLPANMPTRDKFAAAVDLADLPSPTLRSAYLQDLFARWAV